MPSTTMIESFFLFFSPLLFELGYWSTWKAECPVCGAKMHEDNMYCSLKCYNKDNNIK